MNNGRRLIDAPVSVEPTDVPCPTCGAFKGFACGESHVDGFHRRRLLHALGAKGRRVVRSLNTKGAPFYWLMVDRHYYDLIPGYRALYVRRDVEGQPLVTRAA